MPPPKPQSQPRRHSAECTSRSKALETRECWRRLPHPRLVVLDLDCTLWPCAVQQPEYSQPHVLVGDDCVQCLHKQLVPFEEAVAVLREGFTLGGDEWRWGVASANGHKQVCLSLLGKLGLLRGQGKGRIEANLCNIFPGNKDVHLRAVASAAGVPVSEVLLFDDRQINVLAARRVGAVGQLLDQTKGLTRQSFVAGLAAWRSQTQSRFLLMSWLRSPKHCEVSIDGVDGADNALELRQSRRVTAKADIRSDADREAEERCKGDIDDNLERATKRIRPGTLFHWE
eukprot:SAG31_NODE_7874_length_1576_cov_1.626947_1_plen_285_part_00